MKHSMIWLTTIREIRQSLGRFLAIFAIVALGVGLFSGLKITKSVFIQSATSYLNEKSFYDYQILGELGFSEQQVETLKGQSDVLAAEGSISFAAYFVEENGNQKVGKFHSITNDLNKITLKAGRMPQDPTECLADSLAYGKSSLGKKIKISDENTEEDQGHFAQKEFTIVGVVDSSLYLQFERGNTSLGTGTVDVFFYLMKESFDVDYYTEIYVRFRHDKTIYSDDYNEYVDAKKASWEALTDRISHERFLELPAMIADAQDALEEQKRDAQKELDEAKAELDEAWEEITDAEKQIADGKEELQKGRDDIENAKKELADAKVTVEEKEPELEKGREELENGRKKLEDAEKQIGEKEAELELARTQLETAKMTLELGEMQYKLVMEGLISEQKTIDSSRKSLDDRSSQADRREALAKAIGLEAQYAEDIKKERESIQKEKASLDAQEKDLNRRYKELLVQKDQVDAGKKEYEENEKKFKEGEEALNKGKAELLAGKKELLDAEAKLEDGAAQIREGKQKIQQAERDIADGEKTIEEKTKELAEGEEKLAEGKKEYEEGREKYEDAVREFEEKVADAEEAIQKFKDQLSDGEDPAGYLLGRNTNIGYVCFESDSAIVDGIANVFPVFFFLVAALICMTTMNRMVEEQRTQIGVFKALGYSDGRIMFKFVFYSGTAAVTGAILGYVAGTHVFPLFIWTVYGIMYKAGPIHFTFDPMLAGISMFVSMLCSVGTTYVSCRAELASHASALMRPRAPKSGKRVFLEYVPFLWKRLSFLRKVAVRNVVRYKKRFFMMVLGIGGCTGLLLTGFGLKDSITGLAEMQYSEIQTNDLTAIMRDQIDEDMIGKIEALRANGLGKYLTYQEVTLDLYSEQGSKGLSVITLPKGLKQEELDDFWNLKTAKGVKIGKPGKNEAIITDRIAKMFGVTVGSEIFLRDSKQKEMKLKIIGIARNYIYNYVFIDQETWEEQWDAAYEPKSIDVKMAEGRDVKELAPKFIKLEGVANVSVTRDMVKRFTAMMDSMNLIVILVTSCAAGLAFIVLFNLTNINVTERIREIATIKVLGFYVHETALYVFRENFVLTLLGAFVGLFMGKWLHAFVMGEITVEMVSFGIKILPMSYVYSIVLTIAFAGIVSLLMNRRLEAISMTESLKSVD